MTSPMIMRCLGFATGGGPEGQYLKSYDPEAHDGLGEATFTTEKSEARVFQSFQEAWETLGAVPRNRRFRPDGKPNRPLTAFTIQFEPLTD